MLTQCLIAPDYTGDRACCRSCKSRIVPATEARKLPGQGSHENYMGATRTARRLACGGIGDMGFRPAMPLYNVRR